MKLRKVVSLFAAAAMAVSSFAGLGVTASAAETTASFLISNEYTSGSVANGTVLLDSDGLVTMTTYGDAATVKKDSASPDEWGDYAFQFRLNKDYTGDVSNDKQASNAGLIVEPEVDGTCELYIRMAGSKSIYYHDGTKVYTAYAQPGDSGVNFFPTVEIDMTAGTTYCVYERGGTGLLYGATYTAATSDPSIELSSTAETISIGKTVELVAEIKNADGAEVNWTSDDEGVATVENGLVTGIGEGNTTITAMINVNDVEYTATCEVTVVSTGTVSFTATGAEGSAPTAITANIGDSITLPVNKTLYVEGSTLTGWSDGTATYAPGASYTVNGDVTLTAVFEKNAVELGDAETTVVFDLQTKSGTPVVGWEGRTGDILVYQTSINGATIDVKMDVDTTNGGKLANANWTDWAQVNGGTTFTVPALDGAVVQMDTIYGDGTYTINGTEYSQAGQSQGEAITITGAEEIAIVAGATSGSYWRGFSVTYPKVEAGEGPEETDAPATEVTSKTTVITADEMTGVGNAAGSPVILSSTATDATDAYVSKYQDIFGVDFANITTNKYGYLGDSSRGHLETTFTTTADGECTLDVLISYARGSNLITVTDSNGNAILDAVSPTQSEKLGTNGQDLYVYTATIDNLPAGTYTFKWHSESYNSDFLALGITSAESAVEPIEPATPDTMVITADEMTGVGNAAGSPVILSSTATDATAAYVSKYQDIFGVDFANITTNKYGYLGDSSRGHLETTFTTTADGECTLDVLISYARGSNLITVTDSNGNAILDAVSPTQSEKLGTNGQDLYVYTATIDNLPAGTYTFKWHSESYNSDFLALGITYMTSGEAEATPEPDLADVMPDFAYQFANTNSTELTSTTSGTYYLDKDGKLQNAASNQTVTLTNVRYHNTHGLYSNSGATYKFRAKAPFKVTVGTCTFDDGSGKLVVKDLDGNTLYESDTVTFNDACYISSTSNVVEFSYTGTGVVDVIFSTPSGCYFPYIAKTSIDTDTISGTLTGAAGLNEGKITFTSQTTGIVYTGTIANGSYSVVVPTGDTYDVLLTDCDYVAVTTYTANGDNSSADIVCTAASYQSVSGTIVNPPSSEFVLTFTKGDGTTSTATVAAGSTKYVTSLLPGVYTVSSSAGTLSKISQESFQVIGSAVTKNLYYPETIPNATSKTVTVYKDQAVSGTNYHTISDAITGLKNGKISNPTILLKSGETYQEQVRVQNLNGLTLKTDGEAKATITWYYGIGYTYYSLGADGYYDKDRAMTKVGKLEKSPDRWGAVVRVQSDNFTAENIIFENSFNQRYTEAEVADGVMYNGLEAITVDRVNPTIAADSRKATERAAAIAIEGKGVELYNCEFIGSQDTFFTGGTAYVKDCAITGNTDYIFGGGSIVFDNCDLIWGGYSDQEAGGHITASNGSDAGYLFRDCTIKDGNRIKAKGTFGRDWGGEPDSHAYFINCTDATEKGVSGWSNMGGAVNAGTADLHVFDLSDPASYASYGKTDKYNITKFTFEDAAAKYEGAFDTIGFVPSKGTNAETTTKALDGKEDTAKNDYVYGVLTEITAGSGIAVSGVTWTVKDANNKTYTFSTNDSVDGTNMLSKGTFPTITGGGTATISMLFHAPQGTYEVASQAE